MILRPVELLVPDVRRAERPALHRAAGARALSLAARRAGAPGLRFERDEAGAPVAERGWHHSLAHTPGLVVALVAPLPVGVDAEDLARPRRENVRAYLGDEPEALGESDPPRAAVRLFSAKEAVLKCLGIGVAGLLRCRLASVVDAELRLAVDGRPLRCVQRVRGRHVVSVACERPFEVAWTARPAPAEARR